MGVRSLAKLYVILIPDFIVSIYAISIICVRGSIPEEVYRYSIIGVGLYILVKALWMIYNYNRFYGEIDFIRQVIVEFKKGRFSTPKEDINGDDELGKIYRELITMGKHLEDIISSQSTEIMNLRELYNNIVLSISSYFIVINEREEIIFANESFCKKFQFDLDDIIGKKLEEIFFFITGRIRDSIRVIQSTGEPLVLEKTHILSRNRISIIGDIRFSSMVVKGVNQIILVIDDITSKCRKDYQISLISQISETIQRDDEIDRILYTILTGVTSGSGLGFNRAMLFLLNERENTLVGKMAVGPDNMDEAIDVWNSVQSDRGSMSNVTQPEDNDKGRVLLKKVLSKRYPVASDNVFTRSLKNLENIHVYDSTSDERIDDDIREFIDVREFVVVPLIAVNKTIGIIVADNKFNMVPIGNDSIELLSIFAFQAALSIEGYNNIVNLKMEMQKVKERQEAMVESEKLAAVGRIATHIAHEIRNPLVTMGGYAKRIIQLSKNSNKNDEGVIKSAEVIWKESERLEKTLSNVMDFTRISPFIMEFNNINEIIYDTYDLLKNLFQERKIHVVLDLEEDIPLVKSDYNQTKQVMLNLLQNAIDATLPDGRVEIVTYSDEKSLVVLVRNTDSVIDEEDINIVFEPFFTTKITGVGLGLAIVKKIITDHNGEISVRNMEGGGVEFQILLQLPG